ncbi:MAG: pyridoxal 5'-phosphate synthase glutaminase subunit PdxT [Rickettsiella sp.]|nr:pyridoxal 5'-phosphate synthase glutaminase subunit PdxT [Rickettsiella sp.]
MNIGILALQGAYQAHASRLSQLNVTPLLVRNTKELACTDGLIIPGGESSVFIKLLQENTLWADLLSYKKPIFGTCAGAILLAKRVLSPSQPSLNRIDITLQRNAYGRQLDSQVQLGKCLLTQRDIEMVFIRAPKIKTIDGKNIKIVATYSDHAVAIQQDNCIACTFHPELSTDTTLHTYFIQMIKKAT